MNPLIAQILAVPLHSIATMENADFCRQLGRGYQVHCLSHRIKELPEGIDERGTITAYELKKPTTDDRVAVAFMPSDTIFRYNGTFLCIPRTVWVELTKHPRGALPE